MHDGQSPSSTLATGEKEEAQLGRHRTLGEYPSDELFNHRAAEGKGRNTRPKMMKDGNKFLGEEGDRGGGRDLGCV